MKALLTTRHLRYLLCIFFLHCLCPVQASAQNESALWMFGDENVLDFSSGTPALTTLPNVGGGPAWGQYYHAAAVCDGSGNKRFWVKLITASNTSWFNVYNRNGVPMPNGSFSTAQWGNCTPVIVPMPGSPDRYYIFYVRSGGLCYSIVDMALHGGLGDVVTGQKNILLGSNGSVIDQKMTAIAGCSGVWIIVRSRNRAEYYSYEISTAGVNTIPTVSPVGTMPYSWYGDMNNRNGLLEASPNGKRLAAACGTGVPGIPAFPLRGGLELYDFESCSGIISNVVKLDSGYYHGVCFSPDNSKLYATRLYDRTLWQYDLSLPTTAAVIASRTLILTNPTLNTSVEADALGDIRAASNGKLYLGSNTCTSLSFANTLHVINNPDRAGLACNPTLGAVSLGPAGVGTCTGLNLPAEIVLAPSQDTVYDPVAIVTACFRDSVLLRADSTAHCFRWDNGQRTKDRMVNRDGVYSVNYVDQACRLHIHPFRVHFVTLHPTSGGSYTCPGSGTGTVWVNPAQADTALFTYSWTDGRGSTLRQQQSANGDTLRGIDTGNYVVRITTVSGCDTSLNVKVQALPKPVATATVDSLVCCGEPVTFTSTSAEPLSVWSFGPGQVYKQRVVVKTFTIPSVYDAILVVKNVEGCTDMLRKQVTVKGLDLTLTSSKGEVGIGEEVSLSVRAPETFSVLAWRPEVSFTNQLLFDQRVRIDSTTTFIVVGESAYGCLDSAALKVAVRPVVFIPSAFSPNGDGKNDRFRPKSAGDRIFVRRFEVMNRWGQLVWQAYGPAALVGWDGTFNGKPCEVGVYFYSIDIETPAGGTVKRNGDVTLVR